MAGADPMGAVRPKVGRPPRISRQMIAEAANQIGLEGLTLRAVADHLGVTIAALYHHVSGKDDLMRAAAEFSAATVPIPQDTGQHWAVWLQEWAAYNHDIFLAQPALLAQYLEGAIPMETIAVNVDRILGLLVRDGFTVLDANAAYEVVTACALGSAVIATPRTSCDRVGSLPAEGARGGGGQPSRPRAAAPGSPPPGAPARRPTLLPGARSHRVARHRVGARRGLVVRAGGARRSRPRLWRPPVTARGRPD